MKYLDMLPEINFNNAISVISKKIFGFALPAVMLDVADVNLTDPVAMVMQLTTFAHQVMQSA